MSLLIRSPTLTSLIVSCFLGTAVINASAVKEDFEEFNINRRCRVDLPSCFPTQLDWAKLDDSLTGHLAFPSSPNYTAFNFQYNKRTETYPLVHVMVRNAEDIRTAILFARSHNLRVTIKSSGSDFLGRSSAYSSFSINLVLMNDMEVNNRTTSRSEHGEIKVQSGATWSEIFKEVDKHKRVIVGPGSHGSSPSGYTMGGGHSPLSPTLGLAVDNVLEMQVVLADGRISTCTENRTVHLLPDGTKQIENRGDLFWALRGGGGGTFGVLVYIVFKLHAAPESLVRVISLIDMPLDDKNITGEVFRQYNKWTKRAPATWGGYFTVNNYPTQGGQNGGATLFFVKLGPWDENTATDLQEIFELKETLPDGLVTSFWISNISSFWEFQAILSDDHDPRLKRSFTMGTLVSAENHNHALTEFITGELRKDADAPLQCHWSRLGGKVNEFGVSSSSLHPGWRSAESVVSCYFGVEEGTNRLETIKKQEKSKSRASEFTEGLRHFGNGFNLNDGDMHSPNWKLDYWSYQHDELLRIKIRYDPDGLFFCPQCVGSKLPYNYMEPSGSPVVAGSLYVAIVAMLSMVMKLSCT